MLVFRSEEHVDRWIESGHPKGERMTLDQLWMLSKEWFAGRHLLEWNKRTAEESEELLGSVGLHGRFWSFQ